MTFLTAINSNFIAIANIAILVLLVSVAIVIIRSKNLLVATVLLGVFSILMATEYLILGAADVAITEAAVGAGISSILLLLAIFLVGAKEKRVKGKKLLPLMLVGFVAALLTYASRELPVFGDAES